LEHVSTSSDTGGSEPEAPFDDSKEASVTVKG
jgi:hypothetical protein